MKINQLVGRLNENDIDCRRCGDRVVAFTSRDDAERFADDMDLARPWPVFFKTEINTMCQEWHVNVGRVVECR